MMDDDFNGYSQVAIEEFKEHAEEVQLLSRGYDFVEHEEEAEQPLPEFKETDAQRVRSWLNKRPLESTEPQAAFVKFPRRWNTQRGRATHFSLKKSNGTQGHPYGIFRARPTW